MIYSRYLLPESIRENAVITPLSDEPMRRYLGTNIENVGVNIHPVIAHYFQNSIFNQMPEGAAANVLDAFRESVFWRSLYGLGPVIRFGEKVLAIDPRFYWPILFRGAKVGSIIVQPFSDERPSSNSKPPPSRAWVIIVIDGEPRATSAIYEWSGVTLGRLISNDVVSPIAVGVWGDSVGDFHLAGTWALDEISSRTQGISKVLKRFEQPHIQVPASAINYDENQRPQLTVSLDGSVLPVQSNDKDWKYLSLSYDGRLHQSYLEWLVSFISANTFIPTAVLNPMLVRHARADSMPAIASENLETVSKIRYWRSQIVEAAASIGFNIFWNDATDNSQTRSNEENQNDR